MKILITGATGYVGKRVAARLAREHQLSVLVRPGGEMGFAHAMSIEPVVADLSDSTALVAAAGRVDAVFHGAASDAPGFMAVNHGAVSALLKGLPEGGRFVCHGGTAVFGDTGLVEEDGSGAYAPPPPLAPRAALDAMIRAAAGARGLSTAVVYGAFVYGGGTGAMLPTTMLRAAMANGSAGYPLDGTMGWSTIQVDDWADLICKAVTRGAWDGPAYIAAGPVVTMAEVAGLIGGILGVPAISITPQEAVSRFGFLGAALTMNQRFSAVRAMRDFGWTPAPSSLSQELAALAAQLAAQEGQSQMAQP